MSETHAPRSGKRRILSWSIVVLAFGLAGWMQFIQDERETFPQGFHLPGPPPVWREVGNADNGLYYLCQKPGNPIPRGEVTRSGTEITAVLSGRKAWNAELMKCLTDHAPAVRLVAEEALRKPGWHESPREEALYLRDSEYAQYALLAEALNLAGKGHLSEAMSWLELGRRVNARHVAAGRSLSDLFRASNLGGWISQAAFWKVAASTADEALLARVGKTLNTPVVSREQFLAALAAEYSHHRKLFAGEEVGGVRHSAGDFLDMCCESRSDHLLAPLRYKKQATCNLLARHYVFVSRFALQPDKSARSTAAKAATEAREGAALTLWSWEPNRAGRVFAARQMVSSLSLEAAITRNEAAAQANALTVATRRWSLAHGGAQPAKQSDLVPDYLPQVELDLAVPP